MASSTYLATLAVLALGFTSVLGYSNGAPENETICMNMRPGHRVDEKPDGELIDQQSGTPWFTITVSKVKDVAAGDVLDVTIVTTKPGKYIEGFFIQARSSNPETALKGEKSGRYGTWALTDETTQRLRCNNQAVTHYNVPPGGGHTHWDNVTLKWTAPSGTNLNNIAFWATVVKNYREFFMFVQSPILNEVSGAPHLVVPSIILMVITSALALFK